MPWRINPANTPISVPPPYDRLIRMIYALGVIFFLLYMGLFHYYAWTLNTVPNAAMGAIYPLNMHGHVVYLNRFQNRCLTTIKSCGVTCAGTMVLMLLYFQRRR